ncbi:MAG TPA: protein kinase [Ktedonosporobacter sp.]|nr:protein kinase [Ktedonosporobacter sp.]
MQISLSQFCDECGAFVADQATLCSHCGQPPHTQATASHAQALPPPVPINIPRGSTQPLQPGALFAQRYRIVGKAGEGGFGTIYKAQDIDRNHLPVAIKQINLSTLTPREMIEATDSYNREVMHLSRLKHDSLPHIYDYFTDRDHPHGGHGWYIIMDFIKGKTLEELLKKAHRGRLARQKVIEIGIALCDVLSYLHAQNPPIIYRDVKPANIMQTKTGRIYLIDFGIARRYTPGRSKDTGPLGSPGYAAPEQYGRAQTTTQTDIYGLGATLQALLTGKDPLEIAVSSTKQKRRINRRIPKKMQPLLQQMLEPDASKRPRSMEEVKKQLQQLSRQPRAHKIKRTLRFMAQAALDATLLTILGLWAILTFAVSHPLLIPLTFLLLYMTAFVIRLVRNFRTFYSDEE